MVIAQISLIGLPLDYRNSEKYNVCEMNWIPREEIVSDFWWLSAEERTKYIYVGLFHQEPYSDEPNTDKDPSSCPMICCGRHSFEYIEQWRTKHKNTNIFRSLALYDSDSDEGKMIVGPLLLDIDRFKTDEDNIPDIDKALVDVRLMVEKCCSSLGDEDYVYSSQGIKDSILKLILRA